MGKSDQPTSNTSESNDNLSKLSPLSMSFEEVKISPGSFGTDGSSHAETPFIASTPVDETEKTKFDSRLPASSESSQSDNSNDSNCSNSAPIDFSMVTEDDSFVLVSEKVKEKTGSENDVPFKLEEGMSEEALPPANFSVEADEKSSYSARPACNAEGNLKDDDDGNEIARNSIQFDILQEAVGFSHQPSKQNSQFCIENISMLQSGKALDVQIEDQAETENDSSVRAETTDEGASEVTREEEMRLMELLQEAQIDDISDAENLDSRSNTDEASIEETSSMNHPSSVTGKDLKQGELGSQSSNDRVIQLESSSGIHNLEGDEVDRKEFELRKTTEKDEALLENDADESRSEATNLNFQPMVEQGQELRNSPTHAVEEIVLDYPQLSSNSKDSDSSTMPQDQNIASKTEGRLSIVDSDTSAFPVDSNPAQASDNSMSQPGRHTSNHQSAVVDTRDAQGIIDDSPVINEAMFERGKLATELFLQCNDQEEKGNYHLRLDVIRAKLRDHSLNHDEWEKTDSPFPSWLNAKSAKFLPTLSPVVQDADKAKLKAFLQTLRVATDGHLCVEKGVTRKKQVLSYILSCFTSCSDQMENDFDGIVSWMEISLKVEGFSDEDIIQILQKGFEMHCPQNLSKFQSRTEMSSGSEMTDEQLCAKMLKVPTCSDKNEGRPGSSMLNPKKCFACLQWVESIKIIKHSPYCADFCCLCRDCLLKDVHEKVLKFLQDGDAVKIRCLSCFLPDGSLLYQNSEDGLRTKQQFKEWVFKEVLCHLVYLESRRVVSDYLANL